MRIVETDNFGGDFPDEKFLNVPTLPLAKAKQLADTMNLVFNPGGRYNRHWKVVEDDYKLQPGFEP